MEILGSVSELTISEHQLALLATLLAVQWLLARRRIRASGGREKRLAENLDRMQSEATLVLNEKNTFIKNLSYELRTPLSQVIESVKAFSAKEVPDWQQNHLAKIAAAAHALDKVVSGLVDYAAIVNNDSIVSTLSFSVKKKFAHFSQLAPARVENAMLVQGTSLEAMPDCKVLGDPVRLGEMLESMLEVLSSYVHENSMLYIDAVCEIEVPTHAKVQFTFRGNDLRISGAEQERINNSLSQSAFAENFRFGDSSFSIFICHQLALRMGGRLSINKVSKDQLEFFLHLRFPLVEDKAKAVAAESTTEMTTP